MANAPATAGWLSLTWDDLTDWAGTRSVERGRTYQRGGRVKELAVTDAGELLAVVRGTMKYTTTASLVPGKKSRLASACTCPVGLNCKHAVAVIAEYLDAVAKGRPVAKTDGNDPRWADLDEDQEGGEEGYDESEEYEDDEEYDPPSRRSVRRPPTPAVSAADADIDQHIRAKSQGELADLVVSLTRRFPELRKEFQERQSLQSGDVSRLVTEARKEIRRVMALPTYDRWDKRGGGLPNYDPIRQRLERLLELGHPDEVVSLGREFIREGQGQIGRTNDEGETSTEFGTVMPVIFRAVAASKLTGPERLLFAIDTSLDDEYDAVGDAAGVVLDAEWPTAVWSAVADELAKRLTPAKSTKPEDSFSRDYKRDQLTSWIAEALTSAGRGAEVDTLYESEATITRSYERVVRHLTAANRPDDAARWAVEGIAATAADLPGIADQLATHLCERAAKRKQWDVVTAHAAVKFFDRPSGHEFGELTAAAKKAGVEPAVREAALRFLETGAMPYQLNTPSAKARAVPAKPSAAVRKASEPQRTVPPSRVTVAPGWPLPVPAYLEPLLAPRGRYHEAPRPHLNVLLDMAIAAKDSVEVLRWYDAMRAKPKGDRDYSTGAGSAERVAEAVAATHPERAREVFVTALNAALPSADQHAYERVATLFKKLKPIYTALGRAAEWDSLLASVRETYRRRPNLMAALDRMEERRSTIVDAARKKK